jgi:hypothetical protein
MGLNVAMPVLPSEVYQEMDEAVEYMRGSVARDKWGPETGCPNDADALTYEAFEKSAFAIINPLASAVDRIHAK